MNFNENSEIEYEQYKAEQDAELRESYYNEMRYHYNDCPRSQFWDAGEYDAPCYCESIETEEAQRILDEEEYKED